ncbi:MAG: di-trans,poly-cis-decaprenylcistransferase UppS, partial [Porphyrobacter sp. HL-46]
RNQRRGKARHRQRLPAVGGLCQRIFQHRDNIGRERLPVTDDLQFDVVGDEFGQVRFDEFAHQVHQIIDLVFRPFPVLGRKGIERQTFQPGRFKAAHQPPHRLHTALMANRTRQATFLGPSPVAIHDDGDMSCARLVQYHPQYPFASSLVERPALQCVSTLLDTNVGRVSGQSYCVRISCSFFAAASSVSLTY